MTSNNKMQTETLACEVCLNEIPNTVNQHAEADEYVSNFCGLECYQKWRDSEDKKSSNSITDKAKSN